jgi:hypothetical protein
MVVDVDGGGNHEQHMILLLAEGGSGQGENDRSYGTPREPVKGEPIGRF